jgi:hypothetical protein
MNFAMSIAPPPQEDEIIARGEKIWFTRTILAYARHRNDLCGRAYNSVHVMRMKDQLKHESRDRKAHVRWLGAAN